MKKPRQAKGMKLLMSFKRPPKGLFECLHLRARGKWHVFWNHDKGKFDLWALPGAARQCPGAARRM